MFQEGKTTVGRPDADVTPDIGMYRLSSMCSLIT